MKRYIHYGHKHFDKNLFMNIHNSMFTKPNGGLWASDIESKYSWKNWCEENNFIECDEDCSFTFQLSEEAKILKINHVEVLKVLPKYKSEFDMPTWIVLDFEKLSHKYDAIEVNISSDDELYYKLYGWDCDSILVMNPDVVQEFQR